MTSVTGHITEIVFPDPYNKSWGSCDPEDLFDLQVFSEVPEVIIISIIKK